jgi:glycosyltransferase involved in cell wall biosynthesis
MNKKKKINLAFLASTLPVGGAENMLQALVTHIDRDLFSISILCLRSGGRMSEELSRTGADVRDNLVSGKFDISAAWKLPSFLRSIGIDVLCMLNHDDAMFWGKVSARRARIPITLLWVHSNIIPGNKFMARIVSHLTMNMVSRVIVLSQTHRRTILSTHPRLSGEKLVVIYNGVDTEKYCAGEHGKRAPEGIDIQGYDHIIGTVARLSPEKNLEVLLGAARLVLGKEPKALFVIAGDGPEREKYENLTREMGIEGNVRFLGMRRDIPDLLGTFDVAVLSSREEVFPMFLLEAMASGLPVVSTRVGSIEEIVKDGETGYLVEPGDSVELAGRILTFLKDTDQACEMGKRGRMRVEEQFSLRKMVRDTQSLIEGLVLEHSRESTSSRKS